MFRKSFQALLLLVFNGLILCGQTTNPYKSVKIDTTRIVSSSEVVKIAQRFLNRHLNEITYDINEKSFVDEQFRKLEANGADKYKLSQGLSSTAVFFTGTGQSQNIPVVFSAKAVTLFPGDTLIVNNFGAVLRMMDSVKISVPVLLYAKSLFPKAPVILTNLGNSLFELYDDKSAEAFYKKALQLNPDYALAHHGLVSVYLKRKDTRRAMEELFKGISGIYSESLAGVKEKAQYSKSFSPPVPKIQEPKKDSGSSGTNTASGNSGSSATNAIPGNSGNSGISGKNGTPDNSGSSGTNTTSGSSGSSATNATSQNSSNSGISGKSGSNENSGSSGTNSTSGSSATNATSQNSGNSGISGKNGTPDNSGSSGTNSTSGSSGTNATSQSSNNSGISGKNGTPDNSGSLVTNSTSGSSGMNATSQSSNNSGISGKNGTPDNSGSLVRNSASGSSGTNATSQSSNNSGISGKSGSNENSGSSGTNSTSGSSGSSGTNATSQNSVNSGISGKSGSNENSGSSGTNSSSGSSTTNTAPGSSGNSGISGKSGSNENSGSSGTNSSSGSSGTNATSQNSGNSGISGKNGSNENSGSSGTNSSSGSSGSSETNATSQNSGNSGISGKNGTPDNSGSSGTNSISGSSGTNATSQSSNNSGISGKNGTPDNSGSSGTNSTSGSSGSSETNATSQNSGNSGISGKNGSNENSGSSGTNSSSGSSGSSGTNDRSGSQGSPNPNVPIDNLVLPDFPNWSEIAALLNDKSIEKINKKLTQINSGNPALKKAMERTKMTPDQQQKWYENENMPGKIRFKGNESEMDLLEKYFDDQLNAALRNYMRSDSLNIVQFTKMYKQAAADDEARTKQLQSDPAAFQEYLIERCNTFTQINDIGFINWKKVASERHKKYENILVTYWVSCEQYLNRTYDLNEFDALNYKRKAFVASNFGLIYTDYSFRKLQFAFTNLASFGTAAGTCPKAPPPPDAGDSKEDEVKVPDKEPIPCPFKDNKLKIGLGVCNVGLDCESIEAECGEGMIGGAKWNYKKKEMTLFGGAGLQAEFGVKGFASGSYEAKSGFEFTFNSKGQAIDAGFKTEVGSKTSLGNYEGGQTIEVKITAETGIDISQTDEFTRNLF